LGQWRETRLIHIHFSIQRRVEITSHVHCVLKLVAYKSLNGLENAISGLSEGIIKKGSIMNDILIVDDSTQLRTYLTTILSWAGFTVRAVGNGREALEAYKEKSATLVILDIYLPDMDGMETMRALRAMDQHVKVVAISGLRPSLAALCLKTIGMQGALATLEKPFTREALLKTVRSLLGLASES
jgi:CheY-like chemotaxis protein